MKIANLPPKEDMVVTVIPTTVATSNGVQMRCFNLSNVDYSLEEGTAIEGFVGYVHAVNGSNLLGTSAVRYDDKQRPTQVIAVVFTKA